MYEVIEHTKLNLDGYKSDDSVLLFNKDSLANKNYEAEDYFDYAPDGAILIINKEIYDTFKNEYIIFCDKNKSTLNFNNGQYAESFAVFNLTDDKLLILFLDPECGSVIFEDFILYFNEKYNTDFELCDDCHITNSLFDFENLQDSDNPLLERAEIMIKERKDFLNDNV